MNLRLLTHWPTMCSGRIVFYIGIEMSIVVKLKNWAKSVKRDAVTLWFAVKNPLTPWYVKALGAFVVSYALSPIDLIPDFIPILGYVDDVLLLPVLILITVKLMPPEVLQVCRRQADEWMQKEGQKPISRVGMAFVIAIWLIVSWLAYMELRDFF